MQVERRNKACFVFSETQLIFDININEVVCKKEELRNRLFFFYIALA